jgi:hypothetical protein
VGTRPPRAAFQYPWFNEAAYAKICVLVRPDSLRCTGDIRYSDDEHDDSLKDDGPGTSLVYELTYRWSGPGVFELGPAGDARALPSEARSLVGRHTLRVPR